MTEPNSQNEKPKEERRFSQEQYDFLKSCSEKGEEGIKEWNEWRKEHPNKDIFLEGQDFSKWYLKDVNLSVDPLRAGKESVIRRSGRVGSIFDLKQVTEIHLGDAVFDGSKLINASLSGAHLERARLHANLKGAVMREAYLENAILNGAVLEDAKLNYANLQKSRFQDAILRGTVFFHANMRGANLRTALTNNITSFWKIQVDRETHFEGFPLSGVRIDPGTRQLLEYNIRRKNWEEWYKNNDEPIRRGVGIFSNMKLRLITNRLLRWLVRKFWEISDYGISTQQVIRTFFKWALIFAVVYYAFGFIDYYFIGVKDNPGIVSNLFAMGDGQQAVSPWLVPIRAVYFSIVTMTTLGFGDMYANG
ncbi:pentapeptide repeat-containing protein [Planctomycetota bacterium]